MSKKRLHERVRNRVQFFTGTESKVKQAFKDQVDINNIVARFTRDHKVSMKDILARSPSGGFFGDFSDVPDLKTVYERLANAEESFMTLPSKFRMRFDNDPLTFFEFASNPDNSKELNELLGVTYVPEATPSDSAPEVPSKEGSQGS